MNDFPTIPADFQKYEVAGDKISTLPAQIPYATTIVGQYVILYPLAFGNASNWSQIRSDLFSAIGGAENASLWDYMLHYPFADPASFSKALQHWATSTDPLTFAILIPRQASSYSPARITQLEEKRPASDYAPNERYKAVGLTSLHRTFANHRSTEIGHVIYSPKDLQRQPAATEVNYLLSRFVFEHLSSRAAASCGHLLDFSSPCAPSCLELADNFGRYRRLEWKCNALNLPSKRAADRLGFEFEGIFRHHLIVKGRSRDTCWYSMTEEDWLGQSEHQSEPSTYSRKKAFELWLQRSNFSENGCQLRKLEDCRHSL